MLKRELGRMLNKELRVVMYCRVSSQKQKDKHTIASQLQVLPPWARTLGKLVRPPDYYVDDGKTAKAGHLEKRTAFMRLLADMEAGQFDVVCVVEDDRITRADDLLER